MMHSDQAYLRLYNIHTLPIWETTRLSLYPLPSGNMRSRRPPRFCGIMFHVDSSQVYLPFERLTAIIQIVDVSATVKVTQEFWQYSANSIPGGRYVFPVPSRAAVCGFEMRSEDGKVIKAVAKERQQARKEHEAAIQQGLMTGLVEHATDDVFQISLGVLPGQQMLTTTLTYVVDLMDADFCDQVRFRLPVAVGRRYGVPPEGLRGASALIPERISITANIRMKGTIRSITSPSHTTAIMLPQSADAIGSISFFSKDFLGRDFVLLIQADGLDAPRCFAGTHPTGTTALQLTMVPKFNFPPIPVQEYIFLVDHSGSMQGDRIEAARNTLVMLLRSLPIRGTTFNIFKFNQSCESLFGESVDYSEQTLEQATQFVDNIKALGGTEIHDALCTALESRNMHVPTACFVITDGLAYDINAVLRSVSDAVASAKPGAPLRVFTLGIGDSTSTAMCEGIARVGNGICLMAVSSENVLTKCSKLLRASRTYVLTNISVDWGATFSASSDITNQTEMFRQAPEQVMPIFASNRFIICALIKSNDYIVPKNIVIKAQRNGEGGLLTFDVPVELLHAPTSDKTMHLIHTLTARRVIQELDDREMAGDVTNAKEAIIHLGEQYQLASRFTSFVAVEKRNTTTKAVEATIGRTVDEDEDFVLIEDQDFSQPTSMVSFRPSERRQAVNSTTRGSGKSPRKALPIETAGNITLGKRGREPEEKNEQQARPPSPSQSSGSRCLRSGKRYSTVPAPAPAPTPGPVSVASASCRVLPNLPHQANNDVVALIRLQTFNGSFPLTPELERILGEENLGKGSKLGVEPTVWAVVLAVAYLQKRLTGQPGLLESILEKAAEYVSQTHGVNFEELLDMLLG
ncbi:hypothetical protein BC835DRAFT_1343242 [Cytidiella melzeri]|nr:hypothetical protein BC835DRAFT_1343242 [Cytidiella melzeri]